MNIRDVERLVKNGNTCLYLTDDSGTVCKDSIPLLRVLVKAVNFLNTFKSLEKIIIFCANDLNGENSAFAYDFLAKLKDGREKNFGCTVVAQNDGYLLKITISHP